MCIKKTQAYEYGGKLYPTEGDAVTAAITEVASDLFKHHDGHPVKALLDRRDTLIDLLSRHAALEKGEDGYMEIPNPYVGGIRSLNSERSEIDD